MADNVAQFIRSYRRLLTAEVLGIALLASMIGAFAGPFGTFSAMGFGLRLGYWSLIVVMSILLGHTAFTLVRMVGFARGTLSENVAGGVLTAACVTLGVRGVTAGIYGHVLPLPGLVTLFVNVVLITVAVIFLRQLLFRLVQRHARRAAAREVSVAAPVSDQPAAPHPILTRRLPEGMTGEILHLSVCDHHVDIHTEEGTTSVRMRLADAIDAMDGVPGLRVHRSHWVVRDAIEGVERENGRLFLILRTGARVPVSRGSRPILEEAGLL